MIKDRVLTTLIRLIVIKMIMTMARVLTTLIKIMVIMKILLRVLTTPIKIMVIMKILLRMLTTLIRMEASSPTISCCCLPLSPLRSVELFQTNVPPMTFSHLAK